jgi:hypothetical protein
MSGGSHLAHRIAHEFRWIHTGLGLLGNSAFLAGSILFFYEGPLKRIGIWLFVIGAAGMLIGSLGNAIVQAQFARGQRENRRRASGSEDATRPRRPHAAK